MKEEQNYRKHPDLQHLKGKIRKILKVRKFVFVLRKYEGIEDMQVEYIVERDSIKRMGTYNINLKYELVLQ